MPSRPLTPSQKKDAERLLALYKAWHGKNANGRNQEEIAAAAGMKQSIFSQRLNGKVALTKESAAAYAELLGCKVSDFSPSLAAEISTLVKQDVQAVTDRPVAMTAEAVPQTSRDIDKTAWADVRGYPHAMGLGASKEVTDEYVEAHRLKFRADSLRKKGLHARRLAVWECKGDSMLPDVKDGDAVMFDEGDTFPRDGELYVIRIGTSEHHLKRALILDGVTYFAADNPAGDHAWRRPRRMDDRRNPIHVVGRAWWIGRWLA